MQTTLYFAYGSNINEAQMANRCPSTQYQGKAILRNYRYIINQRGVATVLPEAGSTVTGILWALTPKDEKAMDGYEGVGLGIYTRHFLEVEQGATKLTALVYLAQETRHGKSRPGYQETIVAKAREHGFDPDYVRELERWR